MYHLGGRRRARRTTPRTYSGSRSGGEARGVSSARERSSSSSRVGGGVGGFNVEAVLDALNLAGARTSDAEDYDEEEEAERREAAREELELQEALRMSIRESQTDGS